MNCLYITLFFNIVAANVQTFIKSWNQLLYPRVIEVCRLPFEPRHGFFLHLIYVVEVFPSEMFFRWRSKWKSLGARSSNNLFVNFRLTFTFCVEKSYDGKHLAFGRTFGSALRFQTRLTQTTPVLRLSNEHGSQVKDHVRQQCCHNKHKKFPHRPTRDVSLLSGHASYFRIQTTGNSNVWQLSIICSLNSMIKSDTATDRFDAFECMSK